MNLKLATVWTYINSVVGALVAVDGYLQLQHLPSDAAPYVGGAAIVLGATQIFLHALDASAPGGGK